MALKSVILGGAGSFGSLSVCRMEREIENWVQARALRPYNSNVEFWVSGATVAGEGELKALDYLHATNRASTDTVVIVGSDAGWEVGTFFEESVFWR